MEEEVRKNNVRQKLALLIIKVLLIVSVVIISFVFLFGVTVMYGDGMSPAINDGDLLCFMRNDKLYAQNDVIVVEINGQNQVSRIVAGPGDTVDIGEEGGLLINGAYQQELEIYEETFKYENATEFPVTLGSSEYFLLGDSREHAMDSRIYGAVNKGDILGKVFLVIKRLNN